MKLVKTMGKIGIKIKLHGEIKINTTILKILENIEERNEFFKQVSFLH